MPIEQFRRFANNPQLMAMVMRYDPAFDAKQYKTRQDLQTSFTSKKDADEVKSYNTVMDHTVKANDAIDKLGNTGSSWVNAPYNSARGQTSSQFQNARSTMNAEMDLAMAEVNKAATGSHITVDERQYWHSRLNENASPEDLHATMKAFVGMIRGRMDATANKWNTGMGVPEGDPRFKTGYTLMSPQARAQYDKITGGGEKAYSGSGAAAAQTTRAPSTAGQYQEGQTATGPAGQRLVFRNGQWAPLQ